MVIEINGVRKTYQHELSVSELLEIEQVAMKEYVSVQRNETFINREDFDSIKIKDGDIVDFLYYMGGGMG